MSDNISYGNNNQYKPADMGLGEATPIYECKNCGNGNRVPLELRACYWCKDTTELNNEK